MLPSVSLVLYFRVAGRAKALQRRWIGCFSQSFQSSGEMVARIDPNRALFNNAGKGVLGGLACLENRYNLQRNVRGNRYDVRSRFADARSVAGLSDGRRGGELCRRGTKP